METVWPKKNHTSKPWSTTKKHWIFERLTKPMQKLQTCSRWKNSIQRQFKTISWLLIFSARKKMASTVQNAKNISCFWVLLVSKLEIMMLVSNSLRTYKTTRTVSRYWNCLHRPTLAKSSTTSHWKDSKKQIK